MWLFVIPSTIGFCGGWERAVQGWWRDEKRGMRQVLLFAAFAALLLEMCREIVTRKFVLGPDATLLGGGCLLIMLAYALASSKRKYE